MWSILREALVAVVIGPVLVAVVVIGLVSPLLALGALWEARLGPGPYWQAFRMRFRTGWMNTIGRVLQYF